MDWSKVSQEMAEKILGQGETFLQATLTVASGLDQRSATLAGIFSASATAALAASAAIQISDTGDSALVYSGLAVAAMWFFWSFAVRGRVVAEQISPARKSSTELVGRFRESAPDGGSDRGRERELSGEDRLQRQRTEEGQPVPQVWRGGWLRRTLGGTANLVQRYLGFGGAGGRGAGRGIPLSTGSLWPGLPFRGIILE